MLSGRAIGYRTRQVQAMVMLSKAENLGRILRGEPSEWLPIECWSDPRGDGAYRLIQYRGGRAPLGGGYDLWGVRWKDAGQAAPYPVEHPASSPAALLGMPFPEVTDPALWTEAQADVFAIGDSVLPIAWHTGGIWERFWFVLGLERALEALIVEPEMVGCCLARIADWQIQAAGMFIQIGVKAARISDDYGGQNALFMSPRAWRRLIHPQLARIIGRYQEAGVPVILHNCGNLCAIMDDLVDLGVAAFNIQTNANDLAAMRARYGRRFCVWGGISTQTMANGSRNEVRQAVRQAVETLGGDGGLVLEPDQLIDLPEESLQVYFAEAWALRGQEKL